MNKEQRIPVKFEELTEEQKDNILKTLVVLVFQNQKDEFPILKSYAKYGGQAFDTMVKIEETENTIYFKKE